LRAPVARYGLVAAVPALRSARCSLVREYMVRLSRVFLERDACLLYVNGSATLTKTTALPHHQALCGVAAISAENGISRLAAAAAAKA